MAQDRPNVVFIVGDNVGWGDIGCYGGLAPTPRIDALAAQGLRFKNTSDESGYRSYALFAESGHPLPKIWEGVKGSPVTCAHR